MFYSESDIKDGFVKETEIGGRAFTWVYSKRDRRSLVTEAV